eukprot:1121399-Prymnesium_polylepis.1
MRAGFGGCVCGPAARSGIRAGLRPRARVGGLGGSFQGLELQSVSSRVSGERSGRRLTLFTAITACTPR